MINLARLGYGVVATNDRMMVVQLGERPVSTRRRSQRARLESERRIAADERGEVGQQAGLPTDESEQKSPEAVRVALMYEYP